MEIKEKVKRWKEEGKKYIEPTKLEEWISACNYEINGDLAGILGSRDREEFDIALEILKKLSEMAPKEELKALIDGYNLNDESFSLLMNLILIYAPNGPELYKYFALDRKANDIDDQDVLRMSKLNSLVDRGYTLEEAKKLIQKYIVKKVLLKDNTEGRFFCLIDGTFEGYIGFSVVVGKIYEDFLYLVGVEGKKDSYYIFLGKPSENYYIGEKRTYSISNGKMISTSECLLNITEEDCNIFIEDVYVANLEVHKRSLNKENQEILKRAKEYIKNVPNIPTLDFENTFKDSSTR